MELLVSIPTSDMLLFGIQDAQKAQLLFVGAAQNAAQQTHKNYIAPILCHWDGLERQVSKWEQFYGRVIETASCNLQLIG